MKFFIVIVLFSQQEGNTLEPQSYLKRTEFGISEKILRGLEFLPVLLQGITFIVIKPCQLYRS